MTKVLLLSERFGPELGGVAASAGRLADTLASLDMETDVVAFSSLLPAGSATRHGLQKHLVVHTLGRSKALDFTFQQGLNFLEWLHGEKKFDAVWCHYAHHTAFFGTWFAGLHDLPVLVSVRGNDLDRQVFPPGDLARLGWVLSRAKIRIAVSRDLARKIELISGLQAEVLVNAVDSEQFAPGSRSAELARQYGIRDDECVLVFSGELRAKKGLPFLLRGFAEIARRRPTRLLIIGEVRAQDRGAFQRTCAELGDLQEQIICTGHLASPDHVADHLRLGTVFLLPSLWDGMPNSVLEAMAVQLPVITSDAGGLSEIVRHEQTGYVVPKTHLHQLADHVEEYLSWSGTKRKKILESARTWVQEHHHPDGERNAIRELADRLLSR